MFSAKPATVIKNKKNCAYVAEIWGGFIWWNCPERCFELMQSLLNWVRNFISDTFRYGKCDNKSRVISVEMILVLMNPCDSHGFGLKKIVFPSCMWITVISIYELTFTTYPQCFVWSPNHLQTVHWSNIVNTLFFPHFLIQQLYLITWLI